MSFENATPRPWAFNPHVDPMNASARVESKDAHGIDNNGWIIADLFGPDAEANAELIVTAVNAHDLMRTALENSAQALRFVLTEFDPPADAHHQLSYDLELVEAALKLARSET